MKYIIRIKSKKKNPNAGSNVLNVKGEPDTVTEVITKINGEVVSKQINVSRNINRIKLMKPEPEYVVEYQDTEVQCENCSSKFDWTELESDSTDDYYSSSTICPNGAWDCCELEFENL